MVEEKTNVTHTEEQEDPVSRLLPLYYCACANTIYFDWLVDDKKAAAGPSFEPKFRGGYGRGQTNV